MRRWVGRYLIAVGLLHSGAGLVLYWHPLTAMIQAGGWNSVDPHFDRNTAFWFLIAGVLFMLVGGLVDWLESRHLSPPRFLGFGLAALAAVALFFMPLSGFWLFLPAAVVLHRRAAAGRPTPGSGRPILWRRLDVPGHDAATFREVKGGAELRGLAVFQDEGGPPTALHYVVRCDTGWRTTEASIDGWCGAQPVELRLRRDHRGDWTLNGATCPAVAGCEDLDLSFTPATNLLPLRRLDLPVGRGAEVRSAWLEWPAAGLTPLVQRYARRSITEYDYEADLPNADKFVAVLRVDPGGWVLDYAGLWRAETAA